MNNIDRIAGFGNPNALQQFYQTNATGLTTLSFYGFKPVNGDVTFTALNQGTTNVATAYNVSGTYYQSEWYPGAFTSFNLASGEILVYLGEQ